MKVTLQNGEFTSAENELHRRVTRITGLFFSMNVLQCELLNEAAILSNRGMLPEALEELVRVVTLSNNASVQVVNAEPQSQQAFEN